jgi:hypothetical protein
MCTAADVHVKAVHITLLTCCTLLTATCALRLKRQLIILFAAFCLDAGGLDIDCYAIVSRTGVCLRVNSVANDISGSLGCGPKVLTYYCAQILLTQHDSWVTCSF